MSVEDVWKRQRQWSAVADAKSSAITMWRWVNLALILLGAFAGVLAAQSWFPSAAPALGVGGGVVLAVAAFVQKQFLGQDNVKDRVTARVASETLKAGVYRFQSGVVPLDGTDRDAALEAVRSRVADETVSLAAAVREASADAQSLPGAGIRTYLDERARGQLRFHDTKGTSHAALERRWRAAEIAATLLAGALSAAGGVMDGTDLSAWVGVATTAAGAVAAHLASAQHARISASYAVTSDDLEQLINGFDPVPATPESAAGFVAAVEGVLARQNQTWVSTLVPAS